MLYLPSAPGRMYELVAAMCVATLNTFHVSSYALDTAGQLLAYLIC